MSAGRKVAETPGIRSKPVVQNAVRRLITPLATSVQLLALSARELLLTSLPDAIELPDATAKKIGYGFGTGYKGYGCIHHPQQKRCENRYRAERFFSRPRFAMASIRL
jgi:hypothetical protein